MDNSIAKTFPTRRVKSWRPEAFHYIHILVGGKEGKAELLNETFMRACDRHELGAIYCSKSAVCHGLIILFRSVEQDGELSAYQSWNARRCEILVDG
jgi:hypothetical protein